MINKAQMLALRCASISHRQMHRKPKGIIGMMVMAIIVLLIATSLAVFVSVGTANSITQSTRDQINAQRNLDTAIASATYALNQNPTQLSGSGTGTQHNTTTLNYNSVWNWTKTNNATYGAVAGGRIVLGSTTQRTILDQTRAWRNQRVGSVSYDDGKPVYGVAAPSVWQATLASQDASYLTGTFSGDWKLYGNGAARLTGAVPASGAQVISYDDQARFTTAGVPFIRSSFSANLDEHLVAERAQQCGTNLPRYVASNPPVNPADPAAYTWAAGRSLCLYSVNVDIPIHVAGSGVLTVYSHAPIDFRAPVTVSSTAQLHIYTPSGTVRFHNPNTIQAYIYAPNALCKTFGPNGSIPSTVAYTGSLACRQIEMHANLSPFTSLPTIGPAGTVNDGNADHSISYLEVPGYRDRFGN